MQFDHPVVRLLALILPPEPAAAARSASSLRLRGQQAREQPPKEPGA
jgi:hypothetical protein